MIESILNPLTMHSNFVVQKRPGSETKQLQKKGGRTRSQWADTIIKVAKNKLHTARHCFCNLLWVYLGSLGLLFRQGTVAGCKKSTSLAFNPQPNALLLFVPMSRPVTTNMEVITRLHQPICRDSPIPIQIRQLARPVVLQVCMYVW